MLQISLAKKLEQRFPANSLLIPSAIGVPLVFMRIFAAEKITLLLSLINSLFRGLTA
jgi:hypothetical protein